MVCIKSAVPYSANIIEIPLLIYLEGKTLVN